MPRESMGDQIDRLTREVEMLRGERDAARERVAELESGEALSQALRSIDRLARFARECGRWGAATCQCAHHAAPALDEAGVAS